MVCHIEFVINDIDYEVWEEWVSITLLIVKQVIEVAQRFLAEVVAKKFE